MDQRSGLGTWGTGHTCIQAPGAMWPPRPPLVPPASDSASSAERRGRISVGASRGPETSSEKGFLGRGSLGRRPPVLTSSCPRRSRTRACTESCPPQGPGPFLLQGEVQTPPKAWKESAPSSIFQTPAQEQIVEGIRPPRRRAPKPPLCALEAHSLHSPNSHGNRPQRHFY